MATVTVTETGVTLVCQMSRDSQGDRVLVSATSITDVPQIAGRSMMGVDITAGLTAQQLATVVAALDFIEAHVKQEWNIP